MSEIQTDKDHIYVPIEDITALLASNMILYRTARIRKYKDVLKNNMDQMYVERNMKKREKICEEIRKNIATIFQMISENVDDAANLESVINAHKETYSNGNGNVPYIW
jgi:hypothetical protein